MALPWGRAVAPSIQGPGARQRGRDWVKWGLFGAQVGSERRTYELLSLRPTIQGGQVGPKWRQVVPKCRQNVPPNCPNVPTRFPQGSQEGCSSHPKGASESIFGCVQGKDRPTASIGFALGYNLLGLQRVSISCMTRGPGGIHCPC